MRSAAGRVRGPCATLAACCIAGLAWLLVARVFGPSDLWNQTQPKTVSYTTDIIVHGGRHWLLPMERGELPATKPPLYNWLAVPAVALLGFDSEIAHKLPSVLGLLACWLIVVRLGRWLDGASAGGDESLGWLAGLIFVANYSTFKLGYLARPDMLLTLWLAVAWWSATSALVHEGQRPSGALTGPPRTSNRYSLVFWLAVTIAGLTKGPAALVAVAYAIVAARVFGGRWSALRALHPIPGLLVAGLVCGAWLLAAWRIDPSHVRDQLWFHEFYGRVTGVGAEGTHHGTRQWLSELPYQGAYFLTRFAPWSLVALLGLAALVRTRAWRAAQEEPPGQEAKGPPGTPQRTWMMACGIFAVVTVTLYSLSTGKRADYVAVAVPQASLLAAWWLLRSPPGLGRRWPWLAPAAAAVVLAACTWFASREPSAPAPGFGEAIMRFAREANAAMAADPAPVYQVGAGQTHLQAMLGLADADSRHRMDAIIQRAGGAEFWVVGGRLQNPPHEFDLWLAQQRRLGSRAFAVVRSRKLPQAEGWQEQVTLWRVRRDR